MCLPIKDQDWWRSAYFADYSSTIFPDGFQFMSNCTSSQYCMLFAPKVGLVDFTIQSFVCNTLKNFAKQLSSTTCHQLCGLIRFNGLRCFCRVVCDDTACLQWALYLWAFTSQKRYNPCFKKIYHHLLVVNSGCRMLLIKRGPKYQ